MIAAILLGLATPASSAPVPPQAAAAYEERRVAALALAKLVQPEHIVIAAARRGFADGFRAQSSQHPDSPLAKRVDLMVERLLPIAEAEFRGRLPGLWQSMSEVYASELTADEIARARAFFGSPAGQKFITAMNQQPVDLAVARAPDASSYAAATADVGAKAAMQLSPAEQAVMEAWARRDEASIGRVTPKLMEKVVAWMTQPPSPATLERMRAAAAAVMAK